MPLSDHIIVDVFPLFAKTITQADRTIVCVNMGTGGETPLALRGVKSIYVLDDDSAFRLGIENLNIFLTEIQQPLLMIENNNNGRLVLYRLAKNGSTESHILSNVGLNVAQPGELPTSELPDDIANEIKALNQCDYNKQVPLTVNEMMIDGFQYGDSEKQVRIYKNQENQARMLDPLKRKFETSQDNNIIEIYSNGVKDILENIDSVIVLNMMNQLFFNHTIKFDWLTCKEMFTNIDDVSIRIELFHALSYLNEKKCLHDNIGILFLSDIQHGDLSRNCFLNKAFIYAKFHQIGMNTQVIGSYLKDIHGKNLKYLVRILQALEYAKIKVNESYAFNNMLTEPNISIVMQLFDKLMSVDQYGEYEYYNLFSESMNMLYDAKLLTNEFLMFIHEQCQSKSMAYIEELYNMVYDIFYLEDCNKALELLCIAINNSDHKLVDFLLKQGTDINAFSQQKDNHYPPLYFAIKNYNSTLAIKLLEIGAKTDITLDNDMTLLLLAMKKRLFDVVDYITKNSPQDLNFNNQTVQEFVDSLANHNQKYPDLEQRIVASNIPINPFLELYQRNINQYGMLYVALVFSIEEFLNGTDSDYYLSLLEQLEKEGDFGNRLGHNFGQLYSHWHDKESGVHDESLCNQIVESFSYSVATVEFLVSLICKNNDTDLAFALIINNPIMFTNYLKNDNNFEEFTTWLLETKNILLAKRFIDAQKLNIIQEKNPTKLIGDARNAIITMLATRQYDPLRLQLNEDMSEFIQICKKNHNDLRDFKEDFNRYTQGATIDVKLKLIYYGYANQLISNSYFTQLMDYLLDRGAVDKLNEPKTAIALIQSVYPGIDASNLQKNLEAIYAGDTVYKNKLTLFSNKYSELISGSVENDLLREPMANSASENNYEYTFYSNPHESQVMIHSIIDLPDEPKIPTDERYTGNTNPMLSGYVYGPLEKNTATKNLELIIHALLNDTANLIVEHDGQNHVTAINVYMDGNSYDLNEILGDANFDYLVFKPEDIILFSNYIKNNNTAWPFSLLMLTDEKIAELKAEHKLGDDIAHLESGILKAMNLYTNAGVYRDMNNLLEGGYDQIIHTDKNEIKMLLLTSMFAIHGLNAPLPDGSVKRNITYRGMTEKDTIVFEAIRAKLSQIQSDNTIDKQIIIDIKKLVSASLNPNVAVDFTKDKDNNNIITFVNSNAKDISSISQHPEEQETLFAGNQILVELDKEGHLRSTVIRSPGKPSTVPALSMFKPHEYSQQDSDHHYVSAIKTFNQAIDEYVVIMHGAFADYNLKSLYLEIKDISPHMAEFIMQMRADLADEHHKPLTVEAKAIKMSNLLNDPEYDMELHKIKVKPEIFAIVDNFKNEIDKIKHAFKF